MNKKLIIILALIGVLVVSGCADEEIYNPPTEENTPPQDYDEEILSLVGYIEIVQEQLNGCNVKMNFCEMVHKETYIELQELKEVEQQLFESRLMERALREDLSYFTQYLINLTKECEMK